MKKVLFIVQRGDSDKLPSSRIRVLNLLPELQKYGIDTDVVNYPKSIIDRIRLLKRLGEFDIVYLQKKLPTPVEVQLLSKNSNKLIYDFDDAIYYRDDTHHDLESRSRYFKFKYLVEHVDLVVAGNRILSEYAGQFNKNVVVIPSSVETRGIPLKKVEDHQDKFVIGWVGGQGNLHHLKILSTVFQRLSKEYPIQVNILSAATIEIPLVDVKFTPWRLETQDDEIARFDIGVMPLPKNRFTEGKCGYKVLQYMAAGVPPVCSDVGINRYIVEHEKEGFVVSSIDMFYDAIKTLIEDREIRENMGNNARKKIEEHFSVEIIGKTLANLLLHCQF